MPAARSGRGGSVTGPSGAAPPADLDERRRLYEDALASLHSRCGSHDAGSDWERSACSQSAAVFSDPKDFSEHAARRLVHH